MVRSFGIEAGTGILGRCHKGTADITLAELRERLIENLSEALALSTIHDFFLGHRTVTKKDGPRQRARAVRAVVTVVLPSLNL